MAPLLLFTAASAALAQSWDEVDLLKDGVWEDPDSFPAPDEEGLREKSLHVWIDIAVENLAFEKEVGVRYSFDGWATWTDASAWYETGLDGTHERWGVDLSPIGTLVNDGAWSIFVDQEGIEHDVRDSDLAVEYALWATMGGVTWWDNVDGENHRLVLHQVELQSNGDGTIEDLTTGSAWLLCPLQATAGTVDTSADCSGTGAPATQRFGISGCDSLETADRSDWRLPDITELSAFATLSQQVPDLFADRFPASLDGTRTFWSSSDAVPSRTEARAVDIGPDASEDTSGAALSKRSRAFAWCVSSG